MLVEFHLGQEINVLLAENVTVAAHEYIISLIVQCDNFSALEFWLRWEEALEKMCCEHTEGRAEVVQDELGDVACGNTVAG
jgi:hypothetical protein